MGDADLEQIRAKRMAELQAQYGIQGNDNSADNRKAAEERETQIAETRNLILSQALDQGARARLNTLMLCKPEKAKAVENLIINMAQTGRLQGKVPESEFVKILEQINIQSSRTTTVKFDRRRAALDDSDDELN